MWIPYRNQFNSEFHNIIIPFIGQENENEMNTDKGAYRYRYTPHLSREQEGMAEIEQGIHINPSMTVSNRVAWSDSASCG